MTKRKNKVSIRNIKTATDNTNLKNPGILIIKIFKKY